MILTLVATAELLVDRGAYGNELVDKFSSPIAVGNFEVGLSTNMWILDSRIYSLFLSRGRFVGYVSYYDLGTFTYRNEYPDDSAWVEFSPYSIYMALAYRFYPERNVYMSIRAGYYENRVMEEVASSFILDVDGRVSVPHGYLIAYFHNFNPLAFFRGGLLRLPYSIGGGILTNWRKFSIVAGIKKVRDRDLEKYFSVSYTINSTFYAGVSFTPDLEYSKFSFTLGFRRGKLGLVYRGYFPATNLDFASVITLEYNYATPRF